MDAERVPSVAAGTLAALWLPLTGLAMAMGWRSTFQVEREGSMLADFAAHGSAISGPIAPHIVMAIAALVSRRRDRAGTIATAVIGLLGLLLIGNAVAGALLSEPKYTPRAVLLAGALFYFAFGVVFTVSAVRALRAARAVRRSAGARPR